MGNAIEKVFILPQVPTVVNFVMGMVFVDKGEAISLIFSGNAWNSQLWFEGGDISLFYQ